MTDHVTTLAFQLADETARSDIECLCSSVQENGGEPQTVEEFRTCWYDLGNLSDPEAMAYVQRALEYLELRGMLKRHPTNEDWVRVKEEATIARPANHIGDANNIMMAKDLTDTQQPRPSDAQIIATWEEAQRISDLPAVDECLRGFSEDPTGDNGTCIVREVLRALQSGISSSSFRPNEQNAVVQTEQPSLSDAQVWDIYVKANDSLPFGFGDRSGGKEFAIALTKAILAQRQDSEQSRLMLADDTSPRIPPNQDSDRIAELRRVANELRAYSPEGDEYKGKHIHKVWAREIDAAISGGKHGIE